MKKVIISFLVLISLGTLSACTKKDNNKMDTISTGTIFVSTPSSQNEYYTPFSKDIKYFHHQLREEKAPNDKLFSLNFSETSYDDVWIRDVAPVITTRLVKFKYKPQYLDNDVSEDLNQSFSEWLNEKNFNVKYSNLVLDGGNVVWNKKDTIIVTNRILEDNPNLTKNEIIEQLKEELKVKHVILINPEPGDILAHADGMVKFINKDTLFISDFLGDSNFRKKIENTIKQEVPNMKFIVMTSAYTEQGQYDNDIASAKGLYINILETNEAYYVPQFGLNKDKTMLNFIKNHTDKPVIPINIDKLSTMGGAMNCLTWYCPEEFLPESLK